MRKIKYILNKYTYVFKKTHKYSTALLEIHELCEGRIKIIGLFYFNKSFKFMNKFEMISSDHDFENFKRKYYDKIGKKYNLLNTIEYIYGK